MHLVFPLSLGTDLVTVCRVPCTKHTLCLAFHHVKKTNTISVLWTCDLWEALDNILLKILHKILDIVDVVSSYTKFLFIFNGHYNIAKI